MNNNKKWFHIISLNKEALKLWKTDWVTWRHVYEGKQIEKQRLWREREREREREKQKQSVHWNPSSQTGPK